MPFGKSRLVILGCVVLLATPACSDDESADAPSTPDADTASDGQPSEASGAQTSLPTAGAESQDPGKLTEALEESALQVCTTGDYRPYTYLDPDTEDWSGIDIAMAENLAASLEVDLELVQTTWSDLLTDLESKCDIAMGGISFNTDRAKQVFFSTATVQDGKAPISRCADVEKYASVEDINQRGTRVITPIGGTNERFADENFSQAEVIRWDNNNTIFEEIIAGRADVMVTDASETKWVAHTHEELCAVNPDDPFTSFENGYLLPQGDVVWQQYVNAWLRAATADGSYAEAEEPWFG